MGRVEEKVVCQFCGKEYSKAGILNHEKACQMNPENLANEELVEEVVEEVAEATEVVEEAIAEVKEELIKVKLVENIECYIGDAYYRFKANETYEVPENVKNVLKNADLLQAI